jgi:ABC-type nitrate/sulfonate/bicarbonate transport system ATPase subunit
MCIHITLKIVVAAVYMPFAALDVKTKTMLHYQLLQIYENNNKTILFIA